MTFLTAGFLPDSVLKFLGLFLEPSDDGGVLLLLLFLFTWISNDFTRSFRALLSLESVST
jgi:hypothetical protein